MTTTIKRPQSLLDGRLETGMPVIAIPVIAGKKEAASTRLVGVIIGIETNGWIQSRYLFGDAIGGCEGLVSAPHAVTPLEDFGVAVELNRVEKLFRCVPNLDLHQTAEWRQDLSDREWWPYRPEVLAVLDPAYLLENI